ncbi:uncharacterized protein DUF1523 [Yoonia maricola]|uniref:Uncharacterized protein DUF1523 n=1 Tax=Yoonia maricola TaxID=420999 RepID=A0A2M8WQ57_9RHOB|nr:DUF1523 family protein [Yoonia maricola]PJI92966.1 uncharacterized protein DUF1523 [Yoonia maricola]
MQRLKTIVRVLVLLLAGSFLHYVLPQHDIVQISQAEPRRTDFGSFNRWFYAQADSGSTEMENRDIFYIFTEKKETFLLGFIPRDSTETMVYRNEDTGWIWPPYFKFDSSNLHGQATAQARRFTDSADGNWAVITHYGWRIPFLSIFPNAVNITPVENPDVRIIPWFNIFFFVFLIVAIVFIRAAWRQFRERSVDPLLDAAGHQIDEVQADVAERKGRVGRWLGTWRDKNKNRPIK